MGSVMIKCPATGIAIPTGIRADRSSFARTPVFIARAHCPICQTDHEWFAKDAWVQDAQAGPMIQACAEARCEAV
jgi:hypothetical protein